MAQSAYPRGATPRDLLFMGNPGLWGDTYPFLPVVRYLPDGEMDCGVLYDCKQVSGIYGYSSTVFLTNLFEMPPTEAEFLQLPREVFDSVEEMAECGWVVD
jgi:hypothetical protein